MPGCRSCGTVSSIEAVYDVWEHFFLPLFFFPVRGRGDSNCVGAQQVRLLEDTGARVVLVQLRSATDAHRLIPNPVTTNSISIAGSSIRNELQVRYCLSKKTHPIRNEPQVRYCMSTKSNREKRQVR